MRIAPIVIAGPPEAVVVAMIAQGEGKGMISSPMAVIHDQAMVTVQPILETRIATVHDRALQKAETSHQSSAIRTESEKNPQSYTFGGFFCPIGPKWDGMGSFFILSCGMIIGTIPHQS